MGTEKLLDLAVEIIEREWPCACGDAHLRSHCYVRDCPRHTLGPALIHTLTSAASPLAVTDVMVDAAYAALPRGFTYEIETQLMRAAIAAALRTQRNQP